MEASLDRLMRDDRDGKGSCSTGATMTLSPFDNDPKEGPVRGRSRSTSRPRRRFLAELFKRSSIRSSAAISSAEDERA